MAIVALENIAGKPPAPRTSWTSAAPGEMIATAFKSGRVPFSELPPVGEAFPGLLLLSHGGYLGFKARKKDANGGGCLQRTEIALVGPSGMISAQTPLALSRGKTVTHFSGSNPLFRIGTVGRCEMQRHCDGRHSVQAGLRQSSSGQEKRAELTKLLEV